MASSTNPSPQARAVSGSNASVDDWHGTLVSLWYLRLFGLLYLWDGVVGFLIALPSTPPVVNLAANLPHLLIGGAGLAIGLLAPRRA